MLWVVYGLASGFRDPQPSGVATAVVGVLWMLLGALTYRDVDGVGREWVRRTPIGERLDEVAELRTAQWLGAGALVIGAGSIIGGVLTAIGLVKA